jgi:hypothetical protein
MVKKLRASLMFGLMLLCSAVVSDQTAKITFGIWNSNREAIYKVAYV